MKDGLVGMVEKTATRSVRSGMDLKALKELVRRGESESLEFKLKANHPEKIIREVVAFANSNGGILLVGVSDDKSIPGLKFVDEEEYILVRAIDKFCTPKINYRLERISVSNDREVLVFRIPKSIEKPHYVLTNPDSEQKKAYIRLQDKSIQASKEVRQILKWKDKAQNVQFRYGRKEEILMKYLGENQTITVAILAQIAKIPLWLASKTLITLVLANVLLLIPDETEDKYRMLL